MNKKLLSLLFALPLVAMQMNAAPQVTDVSLGASEAHAEDTLTLAANDANTLAAKIQTLQQLYTELCDLEIKTVDAVTRTKDLHPNHPARKAALALQTLVKQATDAVISMHKTVAQAIQAARSVTDSATQKIKKNNQMALEYYNTFFNAIKEVQNPTEGLDIK